MWIPLAFAGVLLSWPVQATDFNCTQCESTLDWADCNLNSTIQACSGTFQACFRAELTTFQLPSSTNSTSFVQGCTSKSTFCIDWDPTRVAVHRCSLCPEGAPQEPCSAAGQPVTIRQFTVKGPNGQPMVIAVLNGSSSSGGPPAWRRPSGPPPPPPPHVIDWQNEPGVFEIFPYGWNETVQRGAAVRVSFGACFAVLVMVVVSNVVANFS